MQADLPVDSLGGIALISSTLHRLPHIIASSWKSGSFAIFNINSELHLSHCILIDTKKPLIKAALVVKGGYIGSN
jgi:hypothetical protein